MPTPRNSTVTSASGQHSTLSVEEPEIQPAIVNSYSQAPSTSAHYNRGMSGRSGFSRPALSSLDSSSDGDHLEHDGSDSDEIPVRSNRAEDTLAEQYTSQDEDKDYHSLVQTIRARDTKSLKQLKKRIRGIEAQIARNRQSKMPSRRQDELRPSLWTGKVYPMSKSVWFAPVLQPQTIYMYVDTLYIISTISHINE